MIPQTSLKVACQQLAPRIGALDYNRNLSAEAIRLAAARGAQVVVLPELVQRGYVFRDRQGSLALSASLNRRTPSPSQTPAAAPQSLIRRGCCWCLYKERIAKTSALLH
ncbi:carbon-nitrogen hydrolase, partial [Pseudomonas sp. MWU12-2534b]